MKKIVFPLFISLLLLFSYSCKKDKFISDSSANLNISADTILFDTVFTTIGSTTKRFKIYNNNNGILTVNTIELAGGEASLFRINIDGNSTTKLTDIEIESGDSLFIFVEVTVDPNNSSTPLIVTDSIIFETNGNLQDIDLVAWGQDAYFYGVTGSAYYINCNSTWLNDKPHVVYGYAVLDTACTLTIGAGTQVHFHNNSGLITLKDSKLDVQGTFGNEVIFQGDRLEQAYQDIPGQWAFIQLQENNNSSITNAIIKNGTLGLVIDGVSTTGTDNVSIKNTQIHDMSSTGLLTRLQAEISVENTLIYNCAEYACGVTSGGAAKFTHCTFANYWKYSVRQTPLFVLNNWIQIEGTLYQFDTDHKFYNCIFYGGNDNEFSIDTLTGSTIDFTFDACIIKTDKETLTDVNYFNTIIKNPNAPFINTIEHDYHHNSTSAGINTGNPSFTLPADIEQKPRGAQPDIGCYEF